MSPPELEHYLHEHFPLSKAMAVSVVSVECEAVVLGAPLAPNFNHGETVFGGSASALAILAAWALVHARLTGDGVPCRLVIQRNSMHYERPISGSFTAHSFLAQPEAWPPFVRALQRKGRARVGASSTLFFEGQAAAHFEGQFVAFQALKPVVSQTGVMSPALSPSVEISGDS